MKSYSSLNPMNGLRLVTVRSCLVWGRIKSCDCFLCLQSEVEPSRTKCLLYAALLLSPHEGERTTRHRRKGTWPLLLQLSVETNQPTQITESLIPSAVNREEPELPHDLDSQEIPTISKTQWSLAHLLVFSVTTLNDSSGHFLLFPERPSLQGKKELY